MNNLAIPSRVPAAAPGTDTANPPPTEGQRFDATLRQSQRSAPKPHDDGHKADDHASTPKSHGDPHKTDEHPSARKSHDDAHKADDDASAKRKDRGTSTSDQGKDPDGTHSVAGMVPAVMTAPAPLPQPIANGSKALPATSGKATGVAIPPGLANAAAPAVTLANGAASSDAAANASPHANLPNALRVSADDADPRIAANDQDAKAASHAGPNSFIAQLAQLAGTPGGNTPTQAPPPVQLAMQTTPDQPQFAQETAQHVTWMAGQGIQRAEIQLNPRKLGPIQVEITTHQDHVDVNFAVQHPQTVHALQQTLPQLHDMLAQQGLNLGHASVGHQAQGQQHAAPTYHAGGDAFGTESDSEPALRRIRIATPGRVDDFA